MTIKAMFAYTNVSEGSRELAKALGVPRVKHTGSTFRPTSDRVILNWGATPDRFPAALNKCVIINRPEHVEKAVKKDVTFNLFRAANVPSPEFTNTRADAVRWLEAGTMVFARTQLRAHSGRGIVIMDPDHPDTWDAAAPLYVKYIPKKEEYRIHVCRGQVIDAQRKGLKAELQGTEGVNFKVRNLANGFIYVRNDGRAIPACVNECAIQAVAALGLDFGAVDIVWNQGQNRAYALEVNTAPGLQGATIDSYRTALSAF